MSRPARAEAPSVDFHVRLSPAERQRLGQAARANHQSVSQFTRDVLMDGAEECLDRRASASTSAHASRLMSHA
jgi:uncharacterized protein (DUF1778 family)